MQRSRSRRHRKVSGISEHSTLELYLHGLGTIIGLGILILPILTIVYYGLLSIYLVIAAGFLALLIGMLIYDISLRHRVDPYSFLKGVLGKEYSFLYGFLLVISFIITTIAAGLASMDELVAFFNLNPYVSLLIVDVIFVIMAVLLFYRVEKKSMNFIGALKIFFVLLLIVVGSLAVYSVGISPYPSAHVGYSFTLSDFGPIGVFSFVLVLFLWMYGGFESIPIVYRGKDRTKVAKALIFSVLSAMLIFFVIQTLVYLVSGYLSMNPHFVASIASMFTANISTLIPGIGIGAPIIIGLSILVILTIAFALMNAGDKVLHDLSSDGILPHFMVKSEGYKLLFTALIPIIVISAIGFLTASSSSESLLYISTIAISALVYVTTFFFLGVGYGVGAYKSRDAVRVAFSVITSLILIALILTFPPGFLVGLAIILIIALAGYILVK